MKHFQVLLLALLAVIAFELALVATKLPAPVAQAQTPPRYAPSSPATQDPHDLIRAQLQQVQGELAGDRQRLTAIERQLSVAAQNEERMLSRVNDDSKRLLMTCVMVDRINKHGDGCVASGWNAQSFHNFDIPFGP